MTEFQDVIAKTQALIDAPTCHYELRRKARAWLNSIGTTNERAAAADFINEAESDIVPIDYVISYANWIGSKKLFDHAKNLKVQGEKFCDCAACTLALDIVKMKNIIL